MTDIIKSIIAIRKEQDGQRPRVSVNNDNINETIWHDDNPTGITNEQILAKQAELQAEFDALAYARAREIAYPNFKEFAEAYCEKEIGGDDTKWNEYVTKYNKVRTDNPKE